MVIIFEHYNLGAYLFESTITVIKLTQFLNLELPLSETQLKLIFFPRLNPHSLNIPDEDV